ncbi:unnamed protein product, partial [marine sediment metagenome]
ARCNPRLLWTTSSLPAAPTAATLPSGRSRASPRRAGSTCLSGVAFGGAGWVRYADAKDAAAKRILKKPIAAYVEKTYEEGDFASLGIGT